MAENTNTEREAFEKRYPLWSGVYWDGQTYVVHDSYVNSYRADRYVGAWEAWQARASLSLPAAGQEPVAPDWWRKRADEIELEVARTGSTEAMRCFTDMRTLLQAVAAAPQPAVAAGWVMVPIEPTLEMLDALRANTTYRLDQRYSNLLAAASNGQAQAAQEDKPSPTPQADSATHPIDPAIAADLERSDWTPEEALRWYAAGKHYDTVPNGDGSSSARILDNGAVASNALKSMSREYAEHKGDVALTAPQADSQPAPDEIVSVAREQGLPETEIEGVFRVNADDLCRVVAADRAASAAPQPAGDWDHGPKANTIQEAARDVGKWLNERPNRPLDLRHVAMLAHYAQAPQPATADGGNHYEK